MTFTILIALIHLFKKMKHCNLDITGYCVIGAGCYIEKDLELKPSPLRIVQRIHENYALAYIYQMAKFGDLMSCG